MSDYDLFTRPRRRIAWFSCGAPSTVAAKLMVEKYGPENSEVIYCDTSNSEHPDNRRYLNDAEEWIGVPIQIISNPKYSSVEEVFEKNRYMSGRFGAKCTVEMKKKPRFAYQKPDDIHFFGMTIEEKRRIKRFEKENHELFLEWILLDWNLSKKNCLDMVTSAGIRIPEMYRLGYENNNCPGCVKSQSPAYWNRIRRDFPEKFAHRAIQSRSIGCRLVKVKGERIFLDELSPLCMEAPKENLSCGPQCRGMSS